MRWRDDGDRGGAWFALLLVLLPAGSSAADADALAFTEAARAHRHRVEITPDGFSGAGYARLLEAGRAADFFLIGEEHGIAENPRLAAQLFRELAPVGYRRLVIEISPPMADVLDAALAAEGLDGLRALYARDGGEPAFFGMAEEAELLAAVRDAVPAGEPALWGVDYEVGAVPELLRRLAAREVPESARTPLAALEGAARAAREAYGAQGDPARMFSFSGDPQLVRDVRAAWSTPPEDVAAILDTLEATLEINGLWLQRRPYESNVRRARLLRENFLGHWQRAAVPRPRVMLKLGASHLTRGLNLTETFDVGSLVPELAAIEGRRVFSMLVLPPIGTDVAVLDPSVWTYGPAAAKDGYHDSLTPLLDACFEDAMTLIDLRPLRSLVTRAAYREHRELMRYVLSYDALLLTTGSAAARELEHAPSR